MWMQIQRQNMDTNTKKAYVYTYKDRTWIQIQR